MTPMEYVCPRCHARSVTADVHEYECEACGESWDSLRELAEDRPKTGKTQSTLTSVTTPGDNR